VTGYIPANPKVADTLSPEQRKELHLDEIDTYQKRLNFWQNVPRRAKYNQIWNEVKAAQ
jgi:putative spermidine/putrescine transport system substrate-binding protein/spermidine/putrescine transport system substrate-binding protein